MIISSVSDLIGITPLLHLARFCTGATLLAKLEYFNPGFSVKDRIALAMIEDAEKRGVLKKGQGIIEPTSGNTGIGLALVCASRSYSLTLVMPETMSVERRQIMKFLGAKVLLSPGNKGMKGAIEMSDDIAKKEGWFQPSQFQNPANPRVHEETTAPEIWADTKGEIDFFVSGVGTGGTLTGVARFLRSQKSTAQIVAVEPAESSVLSGGNPAPHKIQGIGAGFIPPLLDMNLLDYVEVVTSEEALQMSRLIAQQEGLLVGISSGAVLVAAKRIADENPGSRIVTILPDLAERYSSTILFQDATS